MIKKGISFYFFSDEIICGDSDLFKENGMKKLLEAKCDTIEQHLRIADSSEIKPDKPFYAYMKNQFLQFSVFQKAYNNFASLLYGNKEYN